MKNLILTVLAIVMLTTTAYATTVTFIGHDRLGGSYVAAQSKVDTLTRQQVWGFLGDPWRSYGFCDVWVNADQIYIGYYDVYGSMTRVVILPVTSW